MVAATGNCFQNSAEYILANPDRDLTLVHCNVVGTGEKLKGVSYQHAFVIELMKIEEDCFMETAIDVTHDIDNPTIIPLDYYRNIGQVSKEIRYTPSEMRQMMLSTKHYGAWDESLATEADDKAHA